MSKSVLIVDGWSDAQKKDYLLEIKRILKILDSIVHASDSVGVKDVDRLRAGKEVLEYKTVMYEIENALMSDTQRDNEVIRLRRRVQSLEHELKLYHESYGKMFMEIEDAE